MKKLLVLLLAMLLAAAPCALADSINIYTWDGYFNPETISAFTEETGIEVNFSPFASNEDMLVVMENGAAYDIVLASDYALNILRKADLLQPLDMEALTNYENLDPAYLNQYYDPDGQYSIPYAPGSPVLVYNPELVEGEITSFADLFDEQFVDSVCLLDSARVMIGYVNMMLGHDFNTTDDAELAEAAEALQQIKPNVLALDSNLAYQYLLSGEAKAAFLFTSQAVVCEQAMPGAFEYVFPSEGIGFGIDAMVIPASAENPEGANAFLNYLMRPEVAATIQPWTMYLNVNAAAAELLPEGSLDYAALNIPEDLFATKQFAEDLGEYESVYQDIWSEFKLS